MRPSTRRLVWFAFIVLLLQVVVAIPVAIIFRWPYQFGGPGDPNSVARDVVFAGTAISAPVIPILVALAALTVLVRSPRWWGTLSAVAFCVVAVLIVIGGLGEAFAPSTPDVPRAVLITSGAVSAALGLTMLLLAAAELRDRVRAQRYVVPRA